MSQYFLISFSYNTMGGQPSRSQGFVKIDPDKLRSEADLDQQIQEGFDLGRVTRPGSVVRQERVIIRLIAMAPAVSGMYRVQFDASVMGKTTSCSAMLYIDFNAISKFHEVKDLLMDDYNRRNPSPYNLDKRDGCFITCLTKVR